jgi:hypothetical protein
MKTQFGTTFLDSFKRMTDRQRWYWKTWDFFRYDIPRFFRNLWLFRKNLWNHTWYNGDGSVLPWVKTAVDDMAWRIEKHGHEIEESRLKKVAKMRRLSYLIDVCVKDDFIEEAEKEMGFEYIYRDFGFEEIPDRTYDNPLGEKNEKLYLLKENQTPEEKESNSKLLKRAHEIEKEYWEELCAIIKGPDYDVLRDSDEDWDAKYDGSDLRAWWD